MRALRVLAPDEIAYVQYSDVAPSGLQPGVTTDRLPPGRGTVPFAEFFQVLEEKAYRGYLSYEAPNPAAWKRRHSSRKRPSSTASQGSSASLLACARFWGLSCASWSRLEAAFLGG